ncbi:IS6 family transposase [Halorubrum tebenquichense]|uniref:IS240-type transposase (ISH102) n=1 Tax=Halorubrum tebenquichense DSM 14210 TaxID=1227485 RepID=M0DEB5_9EURY|nr:IS6 family transposase [Halorubrum tebenquichense]ELZ33143.1 IS240-type transposase (ISH102) [Halorubrum tebenquichense DSM 14210]
MPEIARLNGGSDCFELDFVEREATPEPAMKLGIRLHLAGLSLSDTVSILDRLGVDRCRTTVHNWVQKADLQPRRGANPDHVAVDETVIQLNDRRYWLYAAVDPATNRLLHIKLSPTRNSAISSMFLSELREKHQVDNAVFLVDGAPWLHAACHRHGLRFQHVTHGNRNSVERVFREVKRRTNQFSNCFSHAEADTVENWLQALAFAWNQLI